MRWTILVSGANYIRSQTVAGYPGAWANLATSRQYSAAAGNGSIWLVGGAVEAGHNPATTADFSSLATQTIGATETVRSITWIAASKTWLLGWPARLRVVLLCRDRRHCADKPDGVQVFSAEVFRALGTGLGSPWRHSDLMPIADLNSLGARTV